MAPVDTVTEPICQLHNHHTADNAKQSPGDDRHSAKGSSFLQKTYPNLLWGSANACKNTKLVNSCVHGNGKGILDDNDQREGSQNRYQDKQRKYKSRGGIVGIPDKIHGKKFIVVYNILGRSPGQISHAGCV